MTARVNVVTGVALALLLAAGCLVGCTATPAPDGASGGGPPSAPDVDRLVSLKGGRKLFLECRGSGSPTVVLLSGTGGAADEWMSVTDTSASGAPPTLSKRSVFDTLAESTHVCAYDRPGTTRDTDALSPSTLVPQPTTAAQGAADLEELLAAAEQPGPYVLVGASWGGMIAQLFARTHQDQVAGIVMVDAASVYLSKTMTPLQWSKWMATIAAAHRAAPERESPNYEASVAELRHSPAPRRVPAAVLSSDQPWDLGVTPGTSTWPAWLAAQDRLARSLHATRISQTDSGHGIAVENPDLVVASVLSVADRANAERASADAARAAG